MLVSSAIAQFTRRSPHSFGSSSGRRTLHSLKDRAAFSEHSALLACGSAGLQPATKIIAATVNRITSDALKAAEQHPAGLIGSKVPGAQSELGTVRLGALYRVLEAGGAVLHGELPSGVRTNLQGSAANECYGDNSSYLFHRTPPYSLFDRKVYGATDSLLFLSRFGVTKAYEIAFQFRKAA